MIFMTQFRVLAAKLLKFLFKFIVHNHQSQFSAWKVIALDIRTIVSFKIGKGITLDTIPQIFFLQRSKRIYARKKKSIISITFMATINVRSSCCLL